MFDWLQFEKREGSRKDRDIIVLALSTCGFCKRGLEFLDSHNFTYRFIYLDTLAKEERRKISEEFRENFKQRSLYPALIVDNKDFQLGFIQKAWEKTLGLEKG